MKSRAHNAEITEDEFQDVEQVAGEAGPQDGNAEEEGLTEWHHIKGPEACRCKIGPVQYHTGDC
eukprot:scaffold50675_cov40-Tisochrysis_lutea.AAC.2